MGTSFHHRQISPVGFCCVQPWVARVLGQVIIVKNQERGRSPCALRNILSGDGSSSFVHTLNSSRLLEKFFSFI